MPSRLLREGILTSERIDELDPGAEVFYRRLMSKVDDHGLYDARAAILRTSLYPLRVDRVREADIARWIAACEKAGVIALYQHAGKPYLQMVNTGWQTRSEPKYPLPPENGCKQPLTVVPVFGVGVVDDIPQTPAPSGADGFEDWWEKYPAFGNRKAAKPQCLAKWVSKGCAAFKARCIDSLETQKRTPKWAEEGGRFVPAPLTWLNQERWNATVEAELAAPKWFETVPGVNAKAAEHGMEKWDECIPFTAFVAKVKKAMEIHA